MLFGPNREYGRQQCRGERVDGSRCEGFTPLNPPAVAGCCPHHDPLWQALGLAPADLAELKTALLRPKVKQGCGVFRDPKVVRRLAECEADLRRATYALGRVKARVERVAVDIETDSRTRKKRNPLSDGAQIARRLRAAMSEP